LDLALIEDSFCLVDFLSKHATSLKIISFRELKLKIGSWETVFIEMKKLLTLSSVYIRGEFDTGEVMEIRSGLWEHARRVLSDEAIEDFIQCKTDDNPFDLLRSARRDFPPHWGGGDWLCWPGCPYREVQLYERHSLKEAMRIAPGPPAGDTIPFRAALALSLVAVVAAICHICGCILSGTLRPGQLTISCIFLASSASVFGAVFSGFDRTRNLPYLLVLELTGQMIVP
jgi:hypothetical protein